MRTKIILLILTLFTINIIAQQYPEVTIRDIQFAPVDSLNFYGNLNTEPKPNYNGDTVTVVGVVMNAPYEGVNPDSTLTLHAGSVPALYLQDENNPEWGGILARNIDASTAFTILDTGLIIKATGVVSEYFTTTQFNVFGFEAQNIIGQTLRPKPVVLTLDSLVQIGSGLPKYEAEKWEGVYVEFRNLTSSDQGIIGYQTFNVFDENNSTIVVGNNSDYYRNTPAPLPGTKIEYVRGYIETRTNINNGWFIINPVYPDDIKYGDVSPPNITNVLRDKGVVKFGEDVTVSARVVDSDGTADVSEVKLFFSINDAPFDSLDMNLTNPTDSIWSATIPAQNDSSLVRYYIAAKDLDNAVSTNPSNQNNAYFYHVLNRDLTIKDVQYSPFGSGFSAYNNYEVTISGIVSADTTDIEGDGANIGAQVYLQDGTGPWSGIQIFGVDADNLRRGDKVSVTGIVNESFGVTRIGTLDNGVQVTPEGTGLPVPQPIVISTSEIATSTGSSLPAESYEGVLVKIENVTILDDNADGNTGPDEGTGGNRNFGEVFITDLSNVQMRMEMQDGTHDYHNFWDTSLENSGIRVKSGNTFESITGILFYSFSNYKLVPRKNDDFVGHVTDVEESNIVPEQYSISQNYPNPFNPSTTIKYSIPKLVSSYSLSKVTLKIYDVLGREIKTLVNESKSAGNYEVQFDASNLTSGIYFYTIKSNNFYQTKKMILMK